MGQDIAIKAVRNIAARIRRDEERGCTGQKAPTKKLGALPLGSIYSLKRLPTIISLLIRSSLSLFPKLAAPGSRGTRLWTG